MKKIILSVALAISAVLTIGAQNKITVEVSGIDNPTGNLYVALYDSKNVFLTNDAVAGKIIGIEGNTVNVVFEAPEDGQYALAIFQDENKNGKLDLGEYGIPTEKYGFSNNADPVKLMRPPLFDECKFTVSGDTSVAISLASATKK